MSQTKISSSRQLAIDGSLDLNSNKLVGIAEPTLSSDGATKGYVDGILAANDALQYKGVIDCSSSPNYPAASAGDTYKISVGGLIGGASGVDVFAADLAICLTDGTPPGTQAGVGPEWDVIHVNGTSGTLSSTAATPLDNQIVRLDSTTGTVVQNSLATIDDAGSMNIPAGQTYKVNGSAIATNATHTGDATGDAALTVVAINGVSLASLATGLLKNTTTSGAPSIATPADITGIALTGFAAGAGTVSATDTILQAINKLAQNAINAANPTFITREVVGGIKNGINATFTLANAPTSGSEMLFLNGLLMNQGAGNDYTISGANITMLTGMIPASSDVFLATYRY